MIKVVKRIVPELVNGTKDTWILGGNRGCGKTVIGALVVLALASQKHAVLYEHKGHMVLVLPDFADLPMDEQGILTKTFKIAGVALVRTAGAYFLVESVPELRTLTILLMDERIIFVQDVGDGRRVVETLLRSRRLVVSSPNAGNLRGLYRHPRYKTIILPTWTLEELLKIQPGPSPEQVKARFQRIGGIPRWVCDVPEHMAEARQEKQIKSLSLSTMTAMMQPGALYGELPAQIDNADDNRSTDLVIILEPNEGNDDSVCAFFASDYVEAAVAQRFVDAQEFDIQQFVVATSSIPALATFRGRAVEAYAHRLFSSRSENSVSVTVQKLLEPPSTEQKTSNFFFKGGSRTYHYVESESNIVFNTYYRPLRRNEPTVVSWAIVDRQFVLDHFPDDPRVTNPAVAYFLVLFQVTVKGSHLLDGTVLNALVANIRAKTGLKQLPLLVCFVTAAGQNGVNSVQAVTRKVGKGKRKPFKNQSQFGCQYALRIHGSFEQVVSKLYTERAKLEQQREEEFNNNDEYIVEDDDELS